MELFRSPYVVITLSPDRQIITNDWFETTENMSDEQYESDMLKFAELAQVYKPKYHLIKSINFKYTISIEMQEWTNNEIFPQLIEAGIQKIAFLVSSEIISQLAIEQTLEESNASAFQVRYFDTENDAFNWLVK